MRNLILNKYILWRGIKSELGNLWKSEIESRPLARRCVPVRMPPILTFTIPPGSVLLM